MIASLRLVLCLGLAGWTSARAENPWEHKLTSPAPGPFPVIEPFTGEFGFGWSDIEAADAKAVFARQGDKMVVDVSGGTTGFVRTLWQVDASHHAEVRVPDLKPLISHQVETYAKRTLVTEVENRADGFWRLRESHPGKAEKWKHIKIDPMHDMISGMLFIRSQRLADHDKVVLIVFPGDTPFLTTVTVLSHEPIKIDGKSIPAIKMDFRPEEIVKQADHKYHLIPHPKFSHGTVWISDDKYRIPLRIEVSIFIGYVFGELKGVTFADGTKLP